MGRVHSESLLSSTDVKGFPIVTADGALTLVGYIDRSELRYVIGAVFNFVQAVHPSSLGAQQNARGKREEG